MSDRDATEAELRALIDGGDLDGATDRALRAWGPEIYGWLSGVLADPTEAADGFAVFAEQLWQSLRRYDGRCSTRTWCYMLARHAASRVREARRRGAAVPLSQAPDIAAAVRTITAVHQQSAVKDELRALPTLVNQNVQFLPYNFYDARVRISQPILRPEIKTNQLIKKEQLVLQEIQTEITKRDVNKEVKKAYYQYLQASELIKILDQSLVILNESESVKAW